MTADQYAERIRLGRLFESLGDNCELAMLQRAWGVEYNNLFRWAFSNSLPQLISILQRRFSGLFEFEDLVPYGGGDMVDDPRNGIAFHTDMKSTYDGRKWVFTQNDEARLDTYLREVQKMTHLIMATRRKLAEGRKVFVYKQNIGTSEAEAMALHDALLPFGPVRLLVVNLAGAEEAPGSARMLRDGLCMGYLDRFAPYDNAGDASEACWFRLLETAAGLLGAAEEAAPETSLCEMLERSLDDPGVLEALRPEGFKVASYRKIYPDLSNGTTNEGMFHHFTRYGYFEGRIWQGGEDEPPCPARPLEVLDLLFRMHLADKARDLLTTQVQDLAGHYRSFAIALYLGARPEVLLACYQGVRQRPGFETFRERCGSLFSMFHTRVAHEDFADFILARHAADGLVGWNPDVLRTTIAMHVARFPAMAPRLERLQSAA